MGDAQLSGSFRLDRSRNAAVQVFEHLREQIVTLALKPGTVLPRNALSDYFGLSQTPIRDALMRLEEERLVDIFPQHATRISAIDIESARQAHFLRLSVELEIVRTLALSHEAGLIANLENLLAQQTLCVSRGDLEGFVVADQAFHRQLYTAADMDELWTLMRARSGNIDRLRRLHVALNGKAQSVLTEHAAMTAAIRQGDPAAADVCVRRHLTGTLSALSALRTQYPGYLISTI